MIRSMTGFGRGEYVCEGKEFRVEVKAVNHRYSDIFIRIPRQISFLEERVREVISKTVFRGKVDVFISYEDYNEDSKTILIDDGLVKSYINAVKIL